MRRPLLLFTTLLALLSAGCSAPEASPTPVAGSPTLKKLGVLTHSTLDEPFGLNEVELADLQALRLRALNEAVATIDRSPDWRAADRAVTRLYASPAYRDDHAAQQLISLALLKGVLLEQPAGGGVEERILHHVGRLVRSGGVDSATIHTGLARVPGSPAAAALAARAAETIHEYRLVTEGKLCRARTLHRRAT